MNWLDIAIILLWGISILMGWRTGLLAAAFSAGGAAAGVFLAGRFSDDVSDLFTDSVSSDTLATVIAYAAILVAVFVAAQVLRGMLAVPLKGAMKAVSIAWVDNLSGVALGIVLGLALSGALIAMMARFANDLPTDVEVSNLDLSGMARTEFQEGLNESLLGSALVPAFLEARGAIPGESLGFVPDDFDVALDILEAQIEGGSREGS